MKRKYYFKPQITINVINADYVMRETSWTSGNGDDFPVVPGHPTDPTGDDDPYGGKEEAKRHTSFFNWDE